MEQILKEVLGYIKTNNLIGIRAGRDRETFLDIWMVVVDDRVFARSWGLSEKSWFHLFKKDPAGAIRCGEKIIPVSASAVANDVQLNERINTAYLEKYNYGENAPYAQGITKPEHVAKTMEFLLVTE
jgi:hypothetical protein